jgi:hypothetical protein
MKVEVGESLMRSWLRHVKGCQLAELNWKPASSWIRQDDCQLLMDASRTHFKDRLAADIFEGTTTAKQLIKQGEIDVLGVKLDTRGCIQTVYGVDIAFHERGLNYGGSEETVSRVLKKLIRSTMIIQTYFGSVSCQTVFASPIIGSSFLDPLEAAIRHLETFLESFKINSKVYLLANDPFREEVLLPTLKMASDTADSSELFLRSYRLLNLFALDKPTKHPLDLATGKPVPAIGSQPRASGKGRNGTLPIDLEPSDKDKFKSDLLRCRRARIIIHHLDGSVREIVWNADRFSESSDVLGNLRSRPEFRQGEWQRHGIARLKVQIAP